VPQDTLTKIFEISAALIIIDQHPTICVDLGGADVDGALAPKHTWLLSLVNNEKLGPGQGVGTVGFFIIGYLIADTRSQNELPAIGKLSMQLTFQA
jgi:hypothetical protein